LFLSFHWPNPPSCSPRLAPATLRKQKRFCSV
jgi:hypothetical protein